MSESTEHLLTIAELPERIGEAIAEHHGGFLRCETCGRQGVGLHEARHENHRLGRRLFVCSDEFACFAAWAERSW